MSYQRERDEFIARCHLSTETARALLRHATTLHRLAEAQCNGDWPCNNGRRETIPCPLCGSAYVPSAIQGGPMARLAWRDQGPMLEKDKKACPDCRTEARVRALLAGTQWQPYFQGDPRGYVLQLHPLQQFDCDRCGRVPNNGYEPQHGSCTGNLKSIPVTRDDMHCGRVSALGVPTR